MRRPVISVILSISAYSVLIGGLSAEEPKLPDGVGKVEFQRICSDCHELGVAMRERHTKAQWSAIVDDMISKGAVGTTDEFALVVSYLTTNFGTQTPSVSLNVQLHLNVRPPFIEHRK